MDEFTIEEAHREQIKQRAESLFQTLDDASLQANLDDLDRTFSHLKQQIQVRILSDHHPFDLHLSFQHRYETLNRAGHHHADYDRRFQSLFETFSSLQTTFYNIRQQENNAEILLQLKVSK